MDRSIQTDLCKGLRACGLPKEVTYELLNTISKWYDSCGPDWTNSRLKDIKQWYLSVLAGEPKPPVWYKKSSTGYPLGAFGCLFKSRNHAKVLAVLSANTLFKEKSLSVKQEEKFLHGLTGNGLGDTQPQGVGKIIENLPGWLPGWNGMTFPEVAFPSTNCVTAITVPVGDKDCVRVHSSEERDMAYIKSWGSIPEATIQYLDESDHLDWIPMKFLKNMEDLTFKEGSPVVGRIGLIQEPGLKLRSVANPNRISQALTKPLATVWDQIVQKFPTDYTYNQEDGITWVQKKLSQGVRLAGSDLSSATDLLSLTGSLTIARHWVNCGLFNGEVRWTEEQISDFWWDYDIAERHFVNLSRGLWYMPQTSSDPNQGRMVRWQQGQPLGLYPSFRLLALTNNSVGIAAASMAGLPWRDSFAVIGDDIIMDARMEPYYTDLIQSIGGEINHSKTLISDRVGEFAGRIIEPTRVSRKTYRFRDPGDDGFMSYVSDLGDQAKALLRPRQRKCWEHYKYVPGFVVPGPWSKDSFGVPLEDRLGWYLTASGLFQEKTADPDPYIRSNEQALLRATLTSQGHGYKVDPVMDLPFPMDEDYLSSEFIDTPLPSGDPRHQNGRSFLEHAEHARKSSRSFHDWKKGREEQSPGRSDLGMDR